MVMAAEHTGMLRLTLYSSYFSFVGSVCLPQLEGINFQKVHEDGTPESMHFPSKFWIIAKFGLRSHSLQALKTSVFHQKKKKAHYFIFFHFLN